MLCLMFKDTETLKDGMSFPSLLLIMKPAACKYNNKSTITNLNCVQSSNLVQKILVLFLCLILFSISLLSPDRQ